MTRVIKLLLAIVIQISDYTIGLVIVSIASAIDQNPMLVREHFKTFIQINNAVYRTPIHWALNKFEHAKDTKCKKKNLRP